MKEMWRLYLGAWVLNIISKIFLSKLGFAQAWKVLENTQRPWKVLEFYHLQVDSTLSQDKIVVPLFDAAYAAPNKGSTILY